MVEFDYSRLRGKIIEVYGTRCEFAKSLGMSQQSLSAKLAGKSAFKQEEILRSAELLSIDPPNIPDYFFSQKV